ncbi:MULTISPECIES: Na+/H+ antiporter subunit E [Pseudovibrio]|uniref:Na+/H+ antiporter subunit E n=1 Tax=Stappiaceae TaxID=2821832 RepID=UPI002365CCBE|nr:MULTISPECIES: Na+/H+ antiporter subunit E [Pseudovibrio]MDD7909170.1 Na+/H+ antiporter subunit E [Pseudovibrio exalbescens]MDX5595615.1 Na+/H+ antiporter subunit E [Pseudovibrio sp. SPO723]
MNSKLFLINLIMTIAWGAVSGSFDALNLVFGFILSSVALYMIREQVPFQQYAGRTGRVVGLAFSFLYEVVASSWRVLVIVLSPNMKLRPGIIALPLTVTKDHEITLLANMITLTPGTLSMDVSDDRKTLFIHCLDVPHPEETIRGIKEGFERQIMECFR